MSSFGFTKSLLDSANDFYKKSLQQFSWYKKVLGTKCKIIRIKEDSKYAEVLGPVYTNNMMADPEVEEFNYVVLISLNDMLDIFNRTAQELEFYDNQDKLKLGDLIIFERANTEFKYKLTKIVSFSEVGGVVNQYTITGLTEVTN